MNDMYCRLNTGVDLDNILVNLKEVSRKYSDIIDGLEKIVFSQPNRKKKIEDFDSKYFLASFLKLNNNKAAIDKLDNQFFKKMSILHDAFIEDYTKVSQVYLKRSVSVHADDMAQAYVDDLKVTFKSIKELFKILETKICSLQIQEFLNKQRA